MTNSKPNCVKGTACGYACISGKKQCSERINSRDAAELLRQTGALVKDSASNTPKVTDPTKAMQLDYLNIKIGEEHVTEFNKVTGMSLSLEELDSIVNSAVQYSNGGKWNNQNYKDNEVVDGAFDKFLQAPGAKYSGTVYRGEVYATEDEVKAALDRYINGQPKLQSWSKSEDVAKSFSTPADSSKKPYSILYKDTSGQMTDIEKFTMAYHIEFTEEPEYREPGYSEREVVSAPGHKSTKTPKVTRNGNQFIVEA